MENGIVEEGGGATIQNCNIQHVVLLLLHKTIVFCFIWMWIPLPKLTYEP